MPNKKYIEIQGLSDAELASELKETEAQYQKLKFDHAIKGLDNPILLRGIRRDMARFHTELRKRELANATPEQLAKRENIRRRRRKK